MVCQLIGREQQPPRARQIALDIKASIRDNVGETLRCSIGMAPNRYLAKIASDMQKPDGLIGLLPSQLPRALMHLDLRDLPGSGRAHRAKCCFARASPQCRSCWNSTAKACTSCGTACGAIACTTGCTDTAQATTARRFRARCRSRSAIRMCLARRTGRPKAPWAVAHKLLHKAAMRLRMEKALRRQHGRHHSVSAHTRTGGGSIGANTGR